MQLQRLVGLATETFNADAHDSIGFEFDFLATITKRLRFDGNLSLNDAEIRNFSSVNSRNPFGATEVLPIVEGGEATHSNTYGCYFGSSYLC